MGLIPQIIRNAGKKSKLFTILTKLLLLLVICILCIAGGLRAFKISYEYVRDPQKHQIQNVESLKLTVEIPHGASTSDIALILKAEGLIRYPILFRAVSKVNGYDGLYQEGKHELNTSMEYLDIMGELKKSVKKKDTIRFTIPEGWELKQIVDFLEQKCLIDRKKFMDLVEKGDFQYDFLKNLPKRPNRLEGYLFPDTYEVFDNADEREIIMRMLDRFNEIFCQQYYDRAKELGMTVDEVVILASIIEREAKLDEERPIVSAVFHNRLKSKDYPLLQSCATVQYVLGERKPILSTEDTKIESLYNTYKYSGLPIGPIASPGKVSIHAALYPDNVDYLFFVAKSDGSHIYSRTYPEHINAANRIQNNR